MAVVGGFVGERPSLWGRRRPVSAEWSPLNLGAALYDMWDAEKGSTLSLSGASVTAWASVKNGYSAAQATGANQPAYSATSFNGRPGITFDGTNDELTFAGTGAFPTGATPCEIWVLCSQDALAADATTRYPFSYGGNGSATDRRVARMVPGGVNRASFHTGNGTGTVTGDNLSVDFSGRHVLRMIVGATTSAMYVDGVTMTAVSVVPGTAAVRTRIGAGPNASASNYHQGVVSLVAVTDPLDGFQSAQMLAYLKSRGGIA